jgi:LL-diaminopimelate aminotransferase
MLRLNENYFKLRSSYLFSEISKRVSAFQQANPGKEILRLGIGDVTLPLPKACIEAFSKAVDEMGSAETFRGYGPEQGYQFLREKIADFDFQARGAKISADEIFVSDGAKCDTGNFQELFAEDIKIGIPDPVYPVYVDTNVMAGRTGENEDGRYEGLFYLPCTKANNFIPEIPEEQLDLIYLCSPNNPTGAVLTKEQLKGWVEYAKRSKALILFDAAYAAFIRDPKLPQSIYEIEGAQEVAVEFRSYSKTAGFTGTRCAYTVVPKECRAFDENGSIHSLHPLWNRRQTTKFNGVSYPVQRAAEAVYSSAGHFQTRALADYYLENAERIAVSLAKAGLEVFGSKNAPYIWAHTGRDSWDFFDMLLNEAGVVCTPGSGFGRCGEGFVRLSAFNSHENVTKALERIEQVLL